MVATVTDEQFAARELVRDWARNSPRGRVGPRRSARSSRADARRLAAGVRAPGRPGTVRRRRSRGRRRGGRQHRGSVRDGRGGGQGAGTRAGRDHRAGHAWSSPIPNCWPRWPPANASPGWRSRVTCSSTARLRGRRAPSLWCWAPQTAGVLLLPAGGKWLLVDTGSDGRAGGAVAGRRLFPAAGPGGADVGAGDPDRRVARAGRGAGRDRAGGRSGRRDPVVAGHRRRLRQGARAVRQADRQLPGHQAPVRGDAVPRRAGRGGRRRRRPRRRGFRGPDQFSIAAALAASIGIAAAKANVKDCIQVLGGIGCTWEHDAHLYLRRAHSIGRFLGGAERWLRRITALTQDGVRRRLGIDLTEVEGQRAELAASRRRSRRAARGEAAGRPWPRRGCRRRTGRSRTGAARRRPSSC